MPTKERVQIASSNSSWSNTASRLNRVRYALAYNANVPAKRRVTVVGFDIHYNDPGKLKILAFLKRVAPGRLAATEALFSTDIENSLETAFFTRSEKERADLLTKLVDARAKYLALLGFLTLNEVPFTNQTGIKNCFVDLRRSRKNEIVTRWLTMPCPIRTIGLYYNAQAETNYFIPTKLTPEFDGIIFFNQTTQARPIVQ